MPRLLTYVHIIKTAVPCAGPAGDGVVGGAKVVAAAASLAALPAEVASASRGSGPWTGWCQTMRCDRLQQHAGTPGQRHSSSCSPAECCCRRATCNMQLKFSCTSHRSRPSHPWGCDPETTAITECLLPWSARCGASTSLCAPPQTTGQLQASTL